MEIIFFILILFFSVILHEVAHGLVAKINGDKTAQYAGRLTLNPQKHIDIFGTIILPLFLHLSNLPIFGYAKPVPINEHNIKTKYGMLMVSIAGIFANLIIVIMSFIFLKLQVLGLIYLNYTCIFILMSALNINLMLAIFNLIPVPPFDGYKVLQELNIIKRSGVIENNLVLQLFFIFIAVNFFGFIYPYISNIVQSFL